MKTESLFGRPVLVTGAGGFVGSTLVERLVREGTRVRALVRYNSRSQHGWLESAEASVRKEVEVACGDLKDPQAVLRAVEGREVVFHLGALVAIPYSYLNPLDFVQTNVVGTAHILNACLEHGGRRVRRLSHEGMMFVDRDRLRAPIDLTRRGVDQPRDGLRTRDLDPGARGVDHRADGETGRGPGRARAAETGVE